MPPYPEITKLIAWRASLQRAVALAARNPDFNKVNAWIKRGMDGSKTYEELDDIGGDEFVTLDMKLASGMTAMLAKSGERGKRVRDRVNLRLEDAARSDGKIIKGRQMVMFLMDSFRTLTSPT